jgi:hypothetical protein
MQTNPSINDPNLGLLQYLKALRQEEKGTQVQTNPWLNDQNLVLHKNLRVQHLRKEKEGLSVPWHPTLFSMQP